MRLSVAVFLLRIKPRAIICDHDFVTPRKFPGRDCHRSPAAELSPHAVPYRVFRQRLQRQGRDLKLRTPEVIADLQRILIPQLLQLQI